MLLPRKMYLKKVCMIFLLEIPLQQNSGCPHLMPKIFFKGHSNKGVSTQRHGKME